MSSLGIKPAMLKTMYLASSITKTDTTIIVNFIKDTAGNSVTDFEDVFGDLGIFVLSPKTSREEIFSFTGFTILGNGKYQLTGVTRGLQSIDPYTADTDYAFDHPANSEVIFSNSPLFYDQFVSTNGTPTITGQWNFSTNPLLNGAVSNSKSAATKEYVDDKTYGAVAQDELIIDEAPANGTIVARNVVKYNDVSNYWEIADQDDSGIDDFDSLVAFAMTDKSGTNTIDVILLGVLTGFTGLTVGAKYYLGDSGGITTTPTGASIWMGTAIASNEMLLADRPINEKVTAALLGSRGTPNSTNKFVTQASLGVDKWSSATTYALGDVVSYNGGIWKSLEDSNTGNTPEQIASLSWFDSPYGYPSATSTPLAIKSLITLPGSGADRTAPGLVVLKGGTVAYYVSKETSPADSQLVRLETTVPYRFAAGSAFVTQTTFDLDTILSAQSVTLTGNVCQSIYVDPTETHIMLMTDAGANSKLMHLEMGTPGDISTVTFSDISGNVTTDSWQGFDFKPDGTKFFYGKDGAGTISFRSLSTPWDTTTMGSESSSTTIAATEDIRFAFSKDGEYVYIAYSGGDGFAIRKANAAWDISSFNAGYTYSVAGNIYTDATLSGGLQCFDELGSMIFQSTESSTTQNIVVFPSPQEPLWGGYWQKISK